MISYSHKEKLLCQQLYNELIKANYRVWIDFDQMHGNVMDAMAQGIERSHIIILCISEQYRKSNYCRAEAHYAFQCQRKIIPILLQKHYKPDGWLLFLIGQLLYIDFTKYEFSQAMNKLFKEFNTSNDTIELNRSIVCSKQTIPVVSTTSKDVDNILEWTPIQVQQWLTEHNLIQMSHLFSDCDGHSLVYLRDFMIHGDFRSMLNSLQEDSLRRTNQNLSIIELSRFLSLIKQQKRLVQLIRNNNKRKES
ncbi:hypothetical protein I4U23_012315 [Adineta vaga]|nr:hypothetical protein I4U23_012315 [Adineta vaga]